MARILDVIEYADASPSEIVHRIPERGSGDFRIGSQLIVREGQMAVFFRDGKALDTFGPGRHTITTANIPLLVNLIAKVFSGNTPFTAEVYFVNMRDFIDQRWGTPEPITLRDAELRMVRLRAHGTFSMAVAEPQLFVGQVVGTRGFYSTDDITGFLRGIIISRLTDIIGENVKTIFDLPAMFDEISATTRVKLRDEFASLGLTLKQLYIMSVSPTDETSKAIEEAASIGAIGNMDAYVKFKAARAMGDAAAQPAGAAGGISQMAMGMATGMAAAKAVADSFAAPQQAAGAQQAAPSSADPVQALQKLKQMLDSGLITQQEYDAKKADILSRL